jgi:ubiquinol-cytochrome c reductase cytochrome b subunit
LGCYLIVFCTFVFFFPGTFIEAANNVPANQLMTPPHIEPEWYFLPFYAILRSIPDMFGGVVAMGLSVVIFAVLPFADRTSIPGGARYRPVYRAVFFVFIADVFFLGYVGSQPPTGILVPLGQFATFIYFATFFLLPPTSKLEERWMRARGLPPQLVALFDERPPRVKIPHEGGAA